MIPFVAIGILEGVKLGVEISAGIIGGKALYPAIKEGLGCNKKNNKKKGGFFKKTKEKLKKVSQAADEDDLDDLFEDIDDQEVEDNI